MLSRFRDSTQQEGAIVHVSIYKSARMDRRIQKLYEFVANGLLEAVRWGDLRRRHSAETQNCHACCDNCHACCDKTEVRVPTMGTLTSEVLAAWLHGMYGM